MPLPSTAPPPVAAAPDGRPGFDEELREMFARRLRLATGVALVLHLVGYLVLEVDHSTTVVMVVRLGFLPFMAALFASTFVNSLRRRAREITVLMVLTLAAYIVWNNASIGAAYDGHPLVLLVVAVGLLFPFTVRVVVPLMLAIVGLYFGIAASMIKGGASMQLVAETFYVAGAATLATVGSIVAYRLREREFEARRELEVANDKAETLLHNTLPAAIADRLKQDPGAIARRYASATVMFADLANFTELSSGLEPEELVTFLNELFSALDRLTERYGLEKIKTIGDAYMVAGGLPEARPDHAGAVARMALEMQRVIKQLSAPGGREIRIRIGIHTGPVVAGVIGTKRLAYDLWGDTVNIASRMESHGEADTIQVSEATYRLLEDRFDFHPRGSIDIKGKGPMNAYLLLRER